MQIELHILLGSAALAVIILIGIIRLISGAKNVDITPEICQSFFAENEPEASIEKITINKAKSAALVETAEANHPYILRAFGNKLVCQHLHNLKSVSRTENSIVIAREGLSYPPITFEFLTKTDADHCASLFKDGDNK